MATCGLRLIHTELGEKHDIVILDPIAVSSAKLAAKTAAFASVIELKPPWWERWTAPRESDRRVKNFYKNRLNSEGCDGDDFVQLLDANRPVLPYLRDAMKLQENADCGIRIAFSHLKPGQERWWDIVEAAAPAVQKVDLISNIRPIIRS